jgi:ATP-dependent DNA helicase RecQ
MFQALRDRFGHDTFRAGQEPVIRALLDGRSALAVFPTGGGKSLCYQLPALLLDGLTLVVSPLIALMKDQVDALTARGIAAARLDSTLDADELSGLYARLESGAIRLLYIAPERFANEAFRQRLKRLPICLVAIDEAHCISEWGHNFRPDYLKLAKILRRLKVPRVLALTATATPKVAREIRKHFHIAAADHIQLSFHRSTLDLRVTPCAAADRKALLLDRLTSLDGAAIVYVTRQETAEEVATYLAKNGLSVRAYHAGLPAEFRAEAQGSFMAGGTRIIVATIAFGMGIDKADIRAVFHYNLPKSLENHTQEIGRAGRDGQPAICEMLACGDDLTVLENFIYSDTPSPRALGNLLDRVLRLGTVFDVSPYDLSSVCDIRPGVIATIMSYLEIDGILEATGGSYATYRAKQLASVDQIRAGRAPAESKFIQRLLDSGEGKRGWIHFNPTELAEEFRVPRDKIVSTLNALHVMGDIALNVSGSRHGYKLKKSPGDLKELCERLAAKFQAREAADLARLQKVLGLSAHRACLTGYLTRHFGEVLPEPCGHCDRCRGIPATTIRARKPRRPSDADLIAVRELVAGHQAALGTPRQLARFLCGMASPATTRARLRGHPAFGLLADLPFADVLVTAEAAI